MSCTRSTNYASVSTWECGAPHFFWNPDAGCADRQVDVMPTVLLEYGRDPSERCGGIDSKDWQTRAEQKGGE